MGTSLTIEDISAGYGAVHVLDHVSLSVASGQTVVLLGTNGNGKSTLIKCIIGLCRPDSGRIILEIDGATHNLARMSTEDIIDLGVGFVPEGRRLFPKLTVEENLLLGLFDVGRVETSRKASHSAMISFLGFPSDVTSCPDR